MLTRISVSLIAANRTSTLITTIGGAIDIMHLGGNQSIWIEDCHFLLNKATDGGAISVLVSDQTSVYIVDSDFYSNVAYCLGGSILFAQYETHVSSLNLLATSVSLY